MGGDGASGTSTGGTDGADSGGTSGTGSDATDVSSSGGRDSGIGDVSTGETGGAGNGGSASGGAATFDAPAEASRDGARDAVSDTSADATMCGNAVVEGSEQCDPPGSSTGNGACTAGCTIPPCSALKVEYVVVLPERVSVPGTARVLSNAMHSGGAPLDYRWSVGPTSGGTFANPSLKETTFQCVVAGQYLITVTVSTALCSGSLSATVTCTGP